MSKDKQQQQQQQQPMITSLEAAIIGVTAILKSRGATDITFSVDDDGDGCWALCYSQPKTDLPPNLQRALDQGIIQGATDRQEVKSPTWEIIVGSLVGRKVKSVAGLYTELQRVTSQAVRTATLVAEHASEIIKLFGPLVDDLEDEQGERERVLRLVDEIDNAVSELGTVIKDYGQ